MPRLPLLFALTIFTSRSAADSSLAAARAGNEGPRCVTLFVEALSSPTARGIEFVGSLGRARHPPAGVQRSLFEVRDASSQLVFRADNAFGIRPPSLDLDLGLWTNNGPLLPDLPPGRYTAVWTVDGDSSQPARFTIGPAPPPPLLLEPRGPPRCGCPNLVAHFTNPGPGVIDLPEALEKSVLFIDGRPHQRRIVHWNGSSNLDPKKSWSFAFTLDEYLAKPAAPGAHRILMEIGGLRSNEVVMPGLGCRA